MQDWKETDRDPLYFKGPRWKVQDETENDTPFKIAQKTSFQLWLQNTIICREF